MNRQQIKSAFRNYFNIRQKPCTIQMPITSRCNSRCKTCNVWKEHETKDIDPIALKEALSDTFFSEVTTVGINGGEFTLVPNFVEIVKTVLTLPKISNIYLITNGLFPKRLYEYLQSAYALCKEKGVHMHLCLSVDGIGKIHEFVRGVPNCFNKTIEIIDKMQYDRERYCSSFSIGCTISIHNAEYIKEVRDFLESYPGLQVEYHCAIPNKRIKTFDNADYYVLHDDRKRLLVAEFFYEEFLNPNKRNKKFQNFANYYFLKNGCNQRLNTCAYLNRDVTIDENLNLSLCATASDIIGNLKEKSATELFHSKKSTRIRKEISNYCKQCGHYSYHPLNIYGRLAYIYELLRSDYLYTYFDIYVKPSSVYRTTELIKLYLKVTKRFIIYSYHYLWKLQ